MRVYIKYNNDKLNPAPSSIEDMTAYIGFLSLNPNCDIVKYTSIKDLDHLCTNPESIVVGTIPDVKHALTRHGVTIPRYDYPDELSRYLHRKIWRSTICGVHEIDETMFPLFVKPVKEKAFHATVLHHPFDYINWIDNYNDDTAVFVSRPINFLAEYRVFVIRHEICDVRWYAGSHFIFPDQAVVNEMVHAWTTAPAGYALDVGVIRTSGGYITALVEVNDGYALGAYGCDERVYAKLLSARWAELTGTEDTFQDKN